MPERIKYAGVAPQTYQAMRALQDYVRSTGLEPGLLELVKLRASYINSCAYCVDMHSKDARAAGETEQRLYAIPVWHETPFFTERERAALEWTESVTMISDGGVSDELYARAAEQFSERELVELTMAVIAINGWNRLLVTFGADVGSYQPPRAGETP
ncbi:MAG: carboxymuconolactone decarboxylase family protein [bacterium]